MSALPDDLLTELRSLGFNWAINEEAILTLVATSKTPIRKGIWAVTKALPKAASLSTTKDTAKIQL